MNRTARTYWDWEVVSAEFEKGGKPYITVKNPKTGAIKDVRQYSPREMEKKFPGEYTRPSKKHLFCHGDYVWRVVDQSAITSWEDGAYYAETWGWYIPPTIEDTPHRYEKILWTE